MELLIGVIVFIPLLILLWVMVRYATRIRRDVLDKDARIRQLESLDGGIVQAALERDNQTCQRCGATERVGVDFIGETPHGDNAERISADDLEATCVACYFDQWKTLQKEQPDLGSRDDDRWV